MSHYGGGARPSRRQQHGQSMQSLPPGYYPGYPMVPVSPPSLAPSESHYMPGIHPSYPTAPPVPAHVASWIQSTPLPMALAQQSSSMSDNASIMSYGSTSSKRKSKKKERKNESPPMIIAPGRSARASAMPMPINLAADDMAGPINPSELLDSHDPQPLHIPATIVGRAGLVRDRDGLVYDPENPRRSLYTGEDGRASRITGAVSAKQAKAIRERAREEEELEERRAVEMVEARRRTIVDRMANDESDEDNKDKKGSDSDADDEENRIVHRLPKNFVKGGIRHRHRHRHRLSKTAAKEDSNSDSEHDFEVDATVEAQQQSLLKVGGKVAAAVSPDSIAQARRDFLFVGPGRSRLGGRQDRTSAIVIRRDSDEEVEDNKTRRKKGGDNSTVDPALFLKPGRARETQEDPKIPMRSDLDDEKLPHDSGSSEDDAEDIMSSNEFLEEEDEDVDEDDDVPLHVRLSTGPGKEGLINQAEAGRLLQHLQNLSVSEEAGAQSSSAQISGDSSDSETKAEGVQPEDLALKMEEMRRRCKQAREDPIAAMAASKFIIENVRNLDTDAAAQKYLCNLAVRSLKKVGTSTLISSEVAAEAQHLLANLHVSGIPGFQDRHRPDYGKAFQLYASAAKKDHADALFHVALCYEQGAGASLSNPRALHNYKKSARKNHPGAMFRLGMALLRGELGQGVNVRDGVKWLKLSAKYADERYPHALYELAMLHDNPIDSNVVWTDHAYVVELLTRGADLDHALCQYKLGEAYEYGLYDCPVDPRQSVYYYSLAAANGQTEAMFELGGWYLTGADDPGTGYHLSQSDPEARKWVSLAADAGLPRAMFAMGYFEEHGIGDPEGADPDESLRWYRRAAEEGDEKAMKKLEEKGVEWKKENEKKTFMSKLGGSSNGAGTKGLQLGSFAPPKASGRGRRAHLEEELDGGNKCLVM
ncbi:hypothetical protein HDU67_009272 [Dinochytrium kinnereticum]|nr:hypothetical protein HDU67_009272 [Dinochytrium kinnereticum]